MQVWRKRREKKIIANFRLGTLLSKETLLTIGNNFVSWLAGKPSPLPWVFSALQTYVTAPFWATPEFRDDEAFIVCLQSLLAELLNNVLRTPEEVILITWQQCVSLRQIYKKYSMNYY